RPRIRAERGEGNHEDVLLGGERQQRRVKNRAVREIETFAACLPKDLFDLSFLSVSIQMPQIQLAPGGSQRTHRNLDRQLHSRKTVKRGTKNLVPVDNPLESLYQRAHVEPSFEEQTAL